MRGRWRFGLRSFARPCSLTGDRRAPQPQGRAQPDMPSRLAGMVKSTVTRAWRKPWGPIRTQIPRVRHPLVLPRHHPARTRGGECRASSSARRGAGTVHRDGGRCRRAAGGDRWATGRARRAPRHLWACTLRAGPPSRAGPPRWGPSQCVLRPDARRAEGGHRRKSRVMSRERVSLGCGAEIGARDAIDARTRRAGASWPWRPSTTLAD
jgi:hypothetical protein